MKKKICIIVGVVCFLILLGFGYQFLLLHMYTVEKPDNVEDVVRGFQNSKTLEVYQNPSTEEALKVGRLTIRNDFAGYVKQEKMSEVEPDIFIKEENGKKYGLNFYSEQNNSQLVTNFVQNDVTFFGNSANQMEKKFLSVDRKNFLSQKGIKNDLDFYQYIGKHYYEENTLFMSRKKMKENYAFNLFVSIAIPQIDEILYISGDYTGYVMRVKEITQIHVLSDEKIYGFFTNDERFLDNSYLKDIIGTIIIH